AHVQADRLRADGASMITARVEGDLTLSGVPAKPVEKLRRALSFANPEVINLKRFGRYWGTTNESLPERIECMIEHPDGSVSVPRGSIETVRETLAREGCRIEAVEDRRTRGSQLGLARADAPSLRYYQREALDAFEKKTQGVIVLPCGGGKTRLGVAAIHRLNVDTLIIAHTSDLLDQWEREVQSLGIVPGVVDGDRGRNEGGRAVVIASVFTLARMLTEESPTPTIAGRWFERFGLVILDEAHHAPAVTFQGVLAKVPAKFRLFLTATPEREDGLTPIMHWMAGPVVYAKDTIELMAEGFLMRPDVVIVESAFAFTYDGPTKRAGDALNEALEKDEARNALIVGIANLDAAEGETVLVLSDRRSHCRLLGRMLKSAGVAHHVVLGTTAKKTRKGAIEELRAGEVPVLVATSLADEGLDVRRLSRVILAWPARAKGRTQQRLGRLMRHWPAKEPKLYDIVDNGVDTLKRRASERRKVYVELGLIRGRR
ncbi:MAG: DEAD/DEAH box helicase, partial [Ginsengibacter sp.]